VPGWRTAIFGLAALTFGVLVILKSGSVIGLGAMLLGVVMIIIGLIQTLWPRNDPLAKLLPGATETQLAMCAALVGVVRNPQHVSEFETRRILHLLAQRRIVQTPEGVGQMARAVAETKGKLLGVLRKLSNAINPDHRADIVIGTFLVMQADGNEPDRGLVYAIGQAIFVDREQVHALIAPYEK